MLKVLLPLIFFTQVATAASPIITKVNQSGFVPAGYQFSETCEVFLRKVVITRKMATGEPGAPAVMKRVLPVTFSPEIHGLIARANQEEFKVDSLQICDAPTTTITAQGPGIKSFPLFRSGRCSEARGERIGGNSWQLREIVDSFCPKTYDPGAGTEL